MPKEIMNYPARIITRTTPQEELLALLDGLDLDDGIEPFFWPAEISSDRLDSYFTHMSEQTLRNFAKDAQAGVSFLDSHDTYKLGFGQSLKGVVEINEGAVRVVADFYTIPGIHFGGKHSYQTTDDFILAVKTRLARDVSVGFYGGKHTCDICGGNFFDFSECSHFPGVEYPIGEQGNETTICTLTIDNARLSEVSAVYDGATPQAMILKAQRMAQAGDLAPHVAEVLQVKYRINLPEQERNFPGIELKSMKRGNTMPKELETIQQMLADAAVENSQSLEEGVRWLIEQREALTKEVADLRAKVTELQPLADDGRAYRADLIDEALAEGVRAMGDDFPMETYRGMLENASLEHIKQVRNALKGQGDEQLPSGRQTVSEDENNEHTTEEVASYPPDVAYAVA